MAFLNEQGLSKLWSKINGLFARKTEVQSSINEVRGEIPTVLPNEHALSIAGKDYNGSEEVAISFKSGTGISIQAINGEVTIEATGDAVAENATNAENASYATYDNTQKGKAENEKVTIDSRFTNLQTAINSNTGTISTLQTTVASNTTAVEKAQGDATKALADAAAADGKAVAAQNDATQALADAATAKSAADAAQETANGKTTMAEVTTALNAYATKEYADTAETDAINAAKGYTDGQIALLLDNPDADINSIKELSAAIAENDSAIDALNSVASSKVSKETEVIAGAGLSGGGALSSNITLVNAGVRSIATGSTNGTISVNTNGSPAEVAVAGLGTAAYKADTYFATATSVTNLSSTVNGLSTSKQDKIVNSDDITIGADNKLTIAAIDVDAFFASLEGTELA